MKMAKAVFGIMLLVLMDFANAQELSPAAPPVKCEFSNGAWCIAERAWEVRRQLFDRSEYEAMWSMRGRFNDKMELIVFVPYSCRLGVSDTAEFIAYEKK